MSLESMAVAIPSLEPGPDFPSIIAGLFASGFGRVIVVDDGSGPEYRDIFERAEALGAIVLRHEVNRGKGAALRTALAKAAGMAVIGVVTADADGQHAPDDVKAVGEALASAIDAGQLVVVLGSRDFSAEHVPPKSRTGNRITSQVTQVLTGRYVSDTQTGLRGFPASLFGWLQSISGDRFEYEMNVLLRLLREKIEIIEVPISTIYHDITNSVSHFRVVRDSARIYSLILGQFLAFGASGLVSAAVDLGLYVAVIDLVYEGRPGPRGIAAAAVAARVVSSVFNFAVNGRVVFQGKLGRNAVGRYYALALGILALSAAGTAALSPLLSGHLVWAKILVDTLLFILSYGVQRRWVFAEPADSQRAPQA